MSYPTGDVICLPFDCVGKDGIIFQIKTLQDATKGKLAILVFVHLGNDEGKIRATSDQARLSWRNFD